MTALSPVPIPDRVLWVDALRAFASLGVAWFHLYTLHGPQLPLPADVAAIINLPTVWGRWGVQLFFVISGFVLALTLIPRRDMVGPGDVGRYLFRRSIRLDVTFWTVLALYLVTLAIFNRGTAPALSWTHALTSAFYFMPFETYNYIPTAWTLAIEVQFYLVFASLVAAANWAMRRGVKPEAAALGIGWALTIGGAPSAIGPDMPEAYQIAGLTVYSIAQFLNTFAVGAAAALIYTRVPGAKRLFAVTMALSAVGAVQAGGAELATVFAGLIFLAIIYIPVLQRALAWRPLVYFGALSYCLYLVHGLIGPAVLKAFTDNVAAGSWAHLAAPVLAMGLSIAASAVIYHLVERPSIAWSKRIPIGRRPGHIELGVGPMPAASGKEIA